MFTKYLSERKLFPTKTTEMKKTLYKPIFLIVSQRTATLLWNVEYFNNFGSMEVMQINFTWIVTVKRGPWAYWIVTSTSALGGSKQLASRLLIQEKIA